VRSPATVVLLSPHQLHNSLGAAAQALAAALVAWGAGSGAGDAGLAALLAPARTDAAAGAAASPWGPCADLVEALLTARRPLPGKRAVVKAKAPIADTKDGCVYWVVFIFGC
jgi:hypothetical protein